MVWNPHIGYPRSYQATHLAQYYTRYLEEHVLVHTTQLSVGKTWSIGERRALWSMMSWPKTSCSTFEWYRLFICKGS